MCSQCEKVTRLEISWWSFDRLRGVVENVCIPHRPGNGYQRGMLMLCS
jgi:hypothetical protein